MNNEELDKLLKSVRVPERTAAYWEEFPASVIGELRRAGRPGPRQPARGRVPMWAWGLGMATACVVVGLALGFRWGRHSSPDSVPLAKFDKYLHEIETLFPGQVQAIVFDDAGPRVVLSETANMPDSPAVFVRLCGSKGCRSFITFSGQRVRMNEDEFEVLVDAQGGIIVLGGQAVWSSAGTRSAGLPYRIEAKPLDASG